MHDPKDTLLKVLESERERESEENENKFAKEWSEKNKNLKTFPASNKTENCRKIKNPLKAHKSVA